VRHAGRLRIGFDHKRVNARLSAQPAGRCDRLAAGTPIGAGHPLV
jgi:hypothetical protein